MIRASGGSLQDTMLQGCQPLVLIRNEMRDLQITLHMTLFILHTTLFSYHDMKVLYFS
jgi:hypothetical protein